MNLHASILLESNLVTVTLSACNLEISGSHRLAADGKILPIITITPQPNIPRNGILLSVEDAAVLQKLLGAVRTFIANVEISPVINQEVLCHFLVVATELNDLPKIQIHFRQR